MSSTVTYGPRVIDVVQEAVPIGRAHAIPFSDILGRVMSSGIGGRSNIERALARLVQWGLVCRERRRVVHGPGRVLNQFVYWRDL